MFSRVRYRGRCQFGRHLLVSLYVVTSCYIYFTILKVFALWRYCHCRRVREWGKVVPVDRVNKSLDPILTFQGWPITIFTLLCMIFHLAEGHHCCAVGTRPWARNQPPFAFFLMLRNLVQWGPLGAALMTALMLDLLSNCKCKQAFALSKGFPAGWAVQVRCEYSSKT